MRALYLLIPFLGICVIAYRYYSAFLAARVLALDDSRVTGYVDSIATVVMMSCVVLILTQSVRRCLLVLGGKVPVVADAQPETA